MTNQGVPSAVLYEMDVVVTRFGMRPSFGLEGFVSCQSAKDYLSRDPANYHIASYQALALAAAGKKAEALSILAKLVANPDCQGDLLHNIARCYALLGDKLQAEIFKAQAVEYHAGPSLKELESDPHFGVKLSRD